MCVMLINRKGMDRIAYSFFFKEFHFVDRVGIDDTGVFFFVD